MSKVVRQRLASREVAGDHPDADILTAYAEQALSLSERSRVLEHLAACRACRDVIALSLPEAVESQPAANATTGRRVWRWRPALGLAASLAMLAVVTTVIIELPRKPASFESARQSPAPVNPAPSNPAEEDKLNAAPQTAQPETAANAPAGGSGTAEPRPAGSRAAGSSAPSTANGAVAGNAVASAEAPAAPAPATTDAGSRTATPSNPAVADARLHERDYVNKQMFVAGQANNDVEATPADLPAAPLPRSLAQNQFPPPLSSNTPLSFAGLPAQTQSGKTVRSRQFSNPPSSHFAFGVIPNLSALRIAEAKAETLAKKSVAIPAGALAFSGMESRAMSPARDEVQTSGADVNEKARGDLDQSSAFSQRALAGGAYANDKDRAGSGLAWKVTGGRLLKSADSVSWADGYTGETIEFSVVSARGSSIWAGGANAALVHSPDGGVSWERITLGASATGSITSIEFAGFNLHVKSSSGQEWSSQDGGKTWSLDK